MVRQREAKKNKEDLMASIESNKRMEKERQERLHQQNVDYKNDLLGQIGYNQRQRQGDIDEEQRMWLAEKEAADEYQRKVEYLRGKPVLDNMHPLRRGLYMSSA